MACPDPLHDATKTLNTTQYRLQTMLDLLQTGQVGNHLPTPNSGAAIQRIERAVEEARRVIQVLVNEVADITKLNAAKALAQSP